MIRWGFRFVLVLLLCVSLTQAATIKGTVYDLSLEQVENVIVGIDSEPKQRLISKDGIYSFDLNPGSYTLTAIYEDDQGSFIAEEKVTISEEGVFVFDLFLLPNLSEDQSLLNETQGLQVGDDEVVDSTDLKGFLSYVGAFFLLLVLVAIIIKLFSAGKVKKQQEQVEKAVVSGDLDEDLQKLIEFVREQNGRTTQKDIRKEFPQSEAKISLMITELEHKGYLERIKKGRGNVIILKK